MISVPVWRQEQEPVWIACQDIAESPETDELIVQFEANGENFVSFVPKRFVDLERKGLWGIIIADCPGGVLVEIPAETLTSGARILVQDSEKQSVFV